MGAAGKAGRGRQAPAGIPRLAAAQASLLVEHERGEGIVDWRGEADFGVDAQTESDLAPLAEIDPVGPLQLRGFAQPVAAFRVMGLRP